MAKPTRRPAGPHVRLLGRDFNLKLKLGDGPAKISDETSGWTTIDRPGDVAMTRWVGAQPLKISIPIYLDGVGRAESINHKLDRLHNLVRTTEGDSRPPTFQVLGPVPFSGGRFVVESIEYGDDIIRGAGGTADAQKLMRQDLTLNLMQYVPSDDIGFHKRKKKKGNGNSGGGRHNSKAGDTPQKVANQVAGPEDDRLEVARNIATLNGIRGTRTAIPEGKSLVLP